MTPPGDSARILLCEDSRTYAEALRVFLERDRDLRVVGTCGSIAELPEAVRRLAPDLLIMDLELPDGSGLTGIRQQLALAPLRILVLSAHAERGSRAAAAALAAGALEARSKSEVKLRDPLSAQATMFRRHVKALARARLASRRSPARIPSRPATAGRAAAAVAICASTGGPAALRTVIGALPGDFPVPVLVVQHMTPGFVEDFVGWLNVEVAAPVRLAAAAGSLSRGTWFAPDGAHLVLDARRRMRLDTGVVAGYHMPSADVLFSSLAAVLGQEVVTVVLTGMGSDGSEGTAAVRAAGGLTLAQDEASSVIYGMPRAARERGAELILPLEAIGPALSGLRLAERGRE